SVKVDPGTTVNTFKYTYTISNSASSHQALDQWAVQYQAPTVISITGTPIGWLKNERIGNSTVAGWSLLLTVLAAGVAQGGFQLEAVGLPGILQAFGVGDVPVQQLPKF